MSQLTMILKDKQSEYKYNYTSILIRPSTKKRVQKYGRIGVTYEKIIQRMLDVLDQNPKIKALVTEYEGYDEMGIEV